MGTALTLAYLVLTILSPADLFPTLIGGRMLLWVAIAATLGSVPALMHRGVVIAQGTGPLVLGLMAAVFMSLIAQGWVGGALNALQAFSASAIMFFLVALNFNGVVRLKWLCWAFILPTLYTAIAGLMAFASGRLQSPYVLVLGESVIRAVRLRGTGFLQDPNDFGQQMVVTLALMPIVARKGSVFRVFFWLAIPVFLYAIYLTQSRGTLLGLGVVLISSARNRIGRFKSGLIFCVLVAAYLTSGFATDRGISFSESSTSNRMTLWGDGIGMFFSSPLFGIGFKNFADEAGQTAHNSFVLCFAELGLFGYIWWMTLLVVAFKQLGKVLAPGAKIDPELVRVAGALRNALIAFVVTSWFLSRTYVITIYLICGAIQVIYFLSRQYAPASAPWFRIDMQRVFGLSAALQFGSLVVLYVIVRVHWFVG